MITVDVINNESIDVSVTDELVTVNVISSQTIDGLIAAASQAQVDAGTAEGVFVNPLTLASKPVKQKAYSAEITFDTTLPGASSQASTGNISLTLASSGNIHGAVHILRIPQEDSRTLTLSSDFKQSGGSETYDNTKDNYLYMWYDAYIEKVHYSVTTETAEDVTAPTLSSAVVVTANPNLLTLTFDEAVNITTAGWTLSSDIGGAITVTAVEGGDGTTTPDFTLSRNVVEGEVITISYSGGATADTNGNALATITNAAVTNSVDNPDITSASVETANPSDFVFTAERAITGTTAGWTPKINGVAATKTGFAGSGTTTITITVSETVIEGDVLTFDYDADTGDMVDGNTNVMQDITGQSVTNNVASSNIVMQDDFAGTAIDTGKWNVTDPADTVAISQNEKLIFTGDGSGNVAVTNNFVDSDTLHEIATGTIQANIQIQATTYNALTGTFELKWPDTGGGQNRILIIKETTSGGKAMRVIVTDDGVNVHDSNVAGTDLSIAKDYRISYDGANAKVDRWDGASWGNLVTQAATFAGNAHATFYSGNNTGGDNKISYFDNFYMTTETGYSTQFPT